MMYKIYLTHRNQGLASVLSLMTIFTILISLLLGLASNLFAGEHEDDHISYEEAQVMADLIYQKANAVWDRLLEDEEKFGISEEDRLSNIMFYNASEKIRRILDKYCRFEYGKPTILSHEEFEKQKTGQKILYRGIGEDKITGFSLEMMSKMLKNGEFLRGYNDNIGIFSTTYRKNKDVDKEKTEMGVRAAEEFTYNKGLIFSFFYDPIKVKVLRGVKQIDKIYNEKYLRDYICNDPNHTSKDLFLSLYIGMSQYEAFAKLLDCKVIEFDFWQYVILDPGIMIFDEQDEFIISDGI